MFDRPIELSFPVKCEGDKHYKLNGDLLPTSNTQFYCINIQSLTELSPEEQEYIVHDYLESKKRISTAIAMLTLHHHQV